METSALIKKELLVLNVKKWCKLNKLSINFKKTNYMIIKSPKKKVSNALSIKFTKYDDSAYLWEKKDHIKYLELGVLIDDSISWKYQLSYICSGITMQVYSLNSGLPSSDSTKTTILLFNLSSYLILCYHSMGQHIFNSSPKNPSQEKSFCSIDFILCDALWSKYWKCSTII